MGGKMAKFGKTYLMRIKGESPLVWNRQKKELEDEKKALKKDQLNEWEEKNWRRKAEFNEDGQVIIPNEWVKGAFIESCKRNRIVPHFATSKNQTYTSYVQSCMFEVLDAVADEKSLKYYGAYVGAQGKNSSTKVWRVRPLVEKWDATIRFIDPFGRMEIKELEDIATYAGLMVGIGDNRINNFGRFDIVSIKEEK